MNVCVIPARGGSKRVPRKNIRSFLGDPIIKYPIRAAQESRLFDRIIVSSEDTEIGEIAQQYGAEWLPRNEFNATDASGTRDVLVEVISQAPAHYVCELYATAALVSSSRMIEAFDRLRMTGAASTRCVIRQRMPAQFALRMDGDRCVPLFPEWRRKKTDQVESTYEDAGMFYWFDWAQWDYEDAHRDSVPIEVSQFEAQDIDTLSDVTMAELKFFLNRRSLDV